MGKRRSKGGSSTQNSKQTTPVASEDETKANKTPKGKKSVVPKSSKEICAKYNLVDIDDQYSEADQANLTSYGLFVRMIRPQLQGVNPKITPQQLAELLTAKWREFNAQAALRKKTEEKSAHARQDMDDEEREREERIRTALAGTVSSDSGDNSQASSIKDKKSSAPRAQLDDSSGIDSSEPEVVTKKNAKSKRTSAKKGGVKVKMQMFTPLRQSKREKKSHKYEDDDDYAQVSDEGTATPPARPKRKRKVKEESSDYNSDGESEFAPKKRVNRKGASTKSNKDKSKKSSARSSVQPTPVGSGAEDEDGAASVDVSGCEQRDEGSGGELGTRGTGSGDDYVTSEQSASEEISEAATSSDEQATTPSRSKRAKKTKTTSSKKKQLPPAIPGERKSERSRKSTPATDKQSQMTDREFNQMLLMSSGEDSPAPPRRANRRSDVVKRKKKKPADATTKAELVKGSKDDNGGYDSDHMWYCEKCGDGGDLLLCDTCTLAYHQKCANLESVPDGQWSCPKCVEAMEAQGSEGEEDYHESQCKFCKQRGECLLCDFCTFVFHPECLNPPLKKIPEGVWKCPYCWTLEKPMKGTVKTILTWRWDHQLKNVDELDHTHSPEKKKKIEEEIKEEEEEGVKRPERQFFVRYKNFSYWDCDWITEMQLLVFQPMMLNYFMRKWDKDEPPSLEDGSSVKRNKNKDKEDDGDPFKLDEKFYRYGVSPDWLQIRRVVNHDGTAKNRSYLVLWRDLDYEDTTWEDPKEIEKNPALWEEFQKHVDIYWKRRKDRLEPRRDIKPPKKSLLKKTLDKQPEYLDATGGKLHPYQLEGFNWLRFSWSQNTNTILADEMGLGKTIQSITFLYSLWKEGYLQGPFLVSAPLTTVSNWEREFEFWAPDMYIVTYLGGKDARAVLREHEFSYKEGAFASYKKPCKMREGHRIKFDVLLTSYEFVNMDYTLLQSIDWDVLVIDEAHRLKSQQSLYFRTLLNFSIDYKLLLTGTPLQNNLEELFNLLNFLERLKFANMEEFLGNFADISKDEQVSKLHEMLAPHMLRRLKIDVMKELPDKKELIVRVELSPMQKKYYKHILTKNYEALNVKGASNATSLMNLMMDLRKCCNHPYLFPTASLEAPVTPKGLYEGKALTEACGKLDLLSKMLDKLRKSKNRVLIFSQMTRVLDLLEDFLAYKDFIYERIDGNISGKIRQAAIDRFNSEDSDSFVFLLSTRAGGLGINLATADTVIIYDMDWNPHNDIQAFSRAHRIGQKNKVMIYRFVCRSTVEERITQTAKKKMMLTELVIHRGMGSMEKTESLNKKEINDILKFGAEDLFADDKDKEVAYDDKAVDALLDRSQASDSHIDDAKAVGVNEYLRSFKVASYKVKENANEEEEKDEEKDLLEDDEDIDDPEYWQRVLGASYTEHKVQQIQEEERRLRSLGKGKRARRQVNYAEAMMSLQGEEDSSRGQKGKDKDKTYNVKDDADYMEEELDKIEVLKQDLEHYGSCTSEEENSDDGDETSARESSRRRARNRAMATPLPGRLGPPPKANGKLPPLLAKVNGNEEVFGFTARQRRSFLDAIMRYGMPPEQGYKSQWLVRDLRMKSEKEFRAYTTLFMRHLCEIVPEHSETYSDGVPREGISRQHILTRIGMLALVRRKVQEFEKENGTYSMKEFKDYIDPKIVERKAKIALELEARKKAEAERETKKDEKKNGKDKNPQDSEKAEEGEKDEDDDKKQDEKSEDEEKTENKNEKESATKKTEETDATQKQESNDEEKSKDNSEEKPAGKSENDQNEKDSDKAEEKTSGDKENDKEGADKTEEADKTEGDKATKEEKQKEPEKEKTPEELAAEKKRKAEELKETMRRRFYIADGNFTELHALWQYEEQYIVEGKEYEVWHRRHDFWLLAGVVTHGYRHWQDILNDPRFSILNKAFKTDSEIMRMAAFLNRRFQLLEQALVIEEQLRKAVEMDASLMPAEKTDKYHAMDHAAAEMRKLANRPASDPPLPKKMDHLLGIMENLVGDVRKMTYTTMPATLARPAARPQQATPTQQPQQHKPSPTPQQMQARPQVPAKGVITID